MRIFARNALKHPRPGHIRTDLLLPRRQHYHSSPVDWRDEILYFLLVDRFSNGKETKAQIFDRKNPGKARPPLPDGKPWRWDLWAESGNDNFQGGTINGVKSKLGYLKNLGISTIWLSPVFKQRGHFDSYHGYGIQDFLDIDPRFGTRKDLVNLIDAAHSKDMRIILDIIFNHSGFNWVYPGSPGDTPPYKSFPDQYAFGAWLDEKGNPAPGITAESAGPDDAVWPAEFMNPDCYTRAGWGGLGDEDIDNPVAVHKRTDVYSLRDFNLSTPETLTNLGLCYKYWIGLTDCDGFRIDTLKHVPVDDARNFCGSIKEYAANLGKTNFFLVGEVAGGDKNEVRYLDALKSNLNAVLDIGEMRIALNRVAKGLSNEHDFFDGFTIDPDMGSHRNIGNRHVSILDDHDHVSGEKIRFSAEVPEKIRDRQVAAAVALQLFTLGIPCIYYGTEQAFSGPEFSERKWLPEWKNKNDRYLREAMFGPRHPRKNGRDGLLPEPDGTDHSLPGFGPFGTAGYHCFDVHYPAYVLIAALAAMRKEYPALRHGRQYLRPIRPVNSGEVPFGNHGPGKIVAWSRILDDEEVLCVVNVNGEVSQDAEVLVDWHLNHPGSSMDIIFNSEETADPGNYAGSLGTDTSLEVVRSSYGAYIRIMEIRPCSIVLLTNHSRPDEGSVIS